MIKENWLLNKLRNTSETCIGTWITVPSPIVVDIISSAGPDFVVIDTEHSPITFESAQLMAITCESRQVSPVFRVPSVIQDRVVTALEIGSHAVQVPNIESADNIGDFVQFARYPPIGGKGLSPYTRACNYSSEYAEALVKSANVNTLLVAQIEGAAGIGNLDSILAMSSIRNIDVIFLGMFDLSNYLNIPGQLENPRLLELFMSLARKISDAGIVVGSIATSDKQLTYLIDSGVRYITYSADCDIISKAYRKIFDMGHSYGKLK